MEVWIKINEYSLGFPMKLKNHNENKYSVKKFYYYSLGYKPSKQGC